MRRSPGQRRQVAPGQAASRPGDVADHVDGDLVACEQVPQFLLCAPLHVLSDPRHRQAAGDAGPERVPGRHIVGQARVGAASDDEPGTRGRTAGKQRGDAGPSPERGRSRLVLIEPVHHDHQPPLPFFRPRRGSCEQAQPHADPRPSHRRRPSAGWPEGVELLDHGVQERVAVGLASKTAGDEKRHDVHPGRGMDDKPRRQRALAGPRPGLPPGIGLGAGAELRPFGELGVAADERIGREIPDLFQVSRLQELPGFGRDDIRQLPSGLG